MQLATEKSSSFHKAPEQTSLFKLFVLKATNKECKGMPNSVISFKNYPFLKM